MASFDLQWRASTKKDLRGIPRDDIFRIVTAVEKLADSVEPDFLFTDSLSPDLHRFLKTETSVQCALRGQRIPSLYIDFRMGITCRESANGVNGMSDIEGKVARASGERVEKRTSFKSADKKNPQSSKSG